MSNRLPFILALLLAAPALARAEEVPAPSSEPTASLLSAPAKTNKRWYGEPMLITDGATFASAIGGTLLLMGAGTANSDAHNGAVWSGMSLIVAAGPVYLFTGAVGHAVRDHWGRAFASLGVRVGVPIGGALVGIIAARCFAQSLPDFLMGGAVGAGAGMIGAALIDDLLLARDDAPRADAKSSTAFQILPTFAPIKDGASVGVVGVF